MLTPADVDHFRGLLEAQEETLQQRIAAMERELAAPGEWQEHGGEDRGDDALGLREIGEIEERLDLARDELDRVHRAMARMDAGMYGISEVSGKPIPRERLEAEPTAITLVEETPAE